MEDMTSRKRDTAAVGREGTDGGEIAAERHESAEQNEAAEPTLTGREVAEYLCAHPDFFARYPRVLLEMELQHQPGGAAVSLVQRQVEVLRKQNEELHAQLKDLVAVARDNQELVEKIHQLAVSLVGEVDVKRRVRLLRTRLKTDFGIENAVLILFAEPYPITSRDPFLKVVERRDARLKSFASFLKSSEPLCVRLRPAQRRFAFGGGQAELNSAALIPLGRHAEAGFIVIASRDPDHFHPGKRADYLGRLGEVVTMALSANRAASDAKSGPKASGT